MTALGSYGSALDSRFFVLLTRKSDRRRFLYGFVDVGAALAFQRRNRAPLPDGMPARYGASEIMYPNSPPVLEYLRGR